MALNSWLLEPNICFWNSVASLLNDRIGLHIDEVHPLPWYPPICEKHPLKLMPYDEVTQICLFFSAILILFNIWKDGINQVTQ